MNEPAGEVIAHHSDDGRVPVQLCAVGRAAWLGQAQLAELYDTSTQKIQQAIAWLLADGEVSEATINSKLIVRRGRGHDYRHRVDVHNIDVEVRSMFAMPYRAWGLLPEPPRTVRRCATDGCSGNRLALTLRDR